MLRKLPVLVAAVLGLLLSGAPHASQFERFGDLQLHYIVFNTTDLSPEMADRYDVTRADNRGLINISGRRTQDDGNTTPVRLSIDGTVTNLLGQQRQLAFTEVEDPQAIYYLETVQFTDRESLRFSLQVTDEETGRTHPLRFSKILWRQ